MQLNFFSQYQRLIFLAGDHGVSKPHALLYSTDLIAELSRFGKPITMDAFKDDFLSSTEGASRSAVKRLTAQIEKELIEATINSPDW